MSIQGNNLTVVILAAGVGSRMKSSIPKAMHILGGVPMIDHLLYKAKSLKPTQVISVIGEDMPKLHDYIITKSDVVHQLKRRGSAHAVYTTKYAHDVKSGVTLILYADTPLVSESSLKQLVDKVATGTCEVCVLGFEKEEENAYGKLVVEGENLLKIVEHKDANIDEKDILLCNSGVMAVKTEIIWELLEKVNNENAQKEYYLTDVVKIANEHNYKCSYVTDLEDNLQGANSKLELADLEMAFQHSMRMKFLDEGVQLVDPDTVFFSMDTKIGKDVVIHPNVHILPKSEIKDGAIIYPFSVIEGAIVGENCKVGPYARLRPQTVLQGENNIGNFVEIKKSVVGIGSKINHLSYIGDASIGKDVNVGAGTITCNYTASKEKFNTYVGDNCFIGSNSSLIAPVKIGNNSLIGAGSVITKSVGDNSLGVSRANQKIFPRKR